MGVNLSNSVTYDPQNVKAAYANTAVATMAFSSSPVGTDKRLLQVCADESDEGRRNVAPVAAKDEDPVKSNHLTRGALSATKMPSDVLDGIFMSIQASLLWLRAALSALPSMDDAQRTCHRSSEATALYPCSGKGVLLIPGHDKDKLCIFCVELVDH